MRARSTPACPCLVLALALLVPQPGCGLLLDTDGEAQDGGIALDSPSGLPDRPIARADSGPPRACATIDDCLECEDCVSGVCEAAALGAICATGACGGDGCCAGCVDRNTGECRSGEDNSACGLGVLCVDCSTRGDRCTDHLCEDAAAVREVDAAPGWSCAITVDRELLCWGRPDANATLDYGTTPVAAAPGLRLATVSLGTRHGCAIGEDAGLYCWGDNDYSAVPTTVVDPFEVARVDAPSTWKMVSVGDEHTCALRADDRLACWGDNSFGQAGAGVTFTRGLVDIAFPETFRHVDAGVSATCAVTSIGRVFCWGRRRLLGILDGSTSVPEVVNTTTRFAVVEVGDDAACGLTAFGELHCWGATESGIAPSPSGGVPRLVAHDRDLRWVGLELGMSHACAVDEAQDLHCWGAPGPWLGLGPSPPSVIATPWPVARIGVDHFGTILGLSDAHTCAFVIAGMLAGNALHCWGEGTSGELGFAATVVDGPGMFVPL